ncbi:MAG: hypothetical protein LBE09_04575 [Christensenellaceae bacterium]|jgi:DNA repair exonuclease SbcCD ATPase subunit|nr:hypothetical protein [Christensenellaceae bacterium]
MKFLCLSYTGYTDKSGVIDFTKKSGPLFVLAGEDARTIKDLLSIALYGTMDGRVTVPHKVELKFERSGVTYKLKREFEEGSFKGIVLLEVQDGTGQVYDSDDAESIITKFVGLESNGFNEFFIIDKETVGDALTSDVVQREKFIDDRIFCLSGTKDTAGRVSEYIEQEKVIKDAKAAIKATTEADVDQCIRNAALIDEKIELLKLEIDVINQQIAAAKEGSGAAGEYTEAVKRAHELIIIKEQLDAEGVTAKSSEETAELSRVYLELKQVRSALEERTEKLNELKAQVAEAKNEADIANEEAEEQQRIFVKQEALMRETGSKFQSTLRLYSENPSAAEAYAVVDEYFATEEDKRAELKDLRNATITTRNEIAKSIKDLVAKKNELKVSPERKKIVYEAALFEESVKLLTDEIVAAETRLEEYKKEKSEIEAQSAQYAEELEKLTTVQKEILALGSSDDFAALKTTYDNENKSVAQLTARYYQVNAVGREYEEIKDKIESAKASVERFNEKLALANKEKENVLIQMEKMDGRLKLLLAKRAEYEGFNKMRDITDSLLYGSHCPVCDGYITYKRELPQKDTKPLDAQIQSQQAEYDKFNAKLLELTATIGQREAAVKVGMQYVDSLTGTLEASDARVAEALEKSQVDNIDNLKALLDEATSNVEILADLISKYTANEVELQRAWAAEKYATTRLAVLNDEIIVSENNKLAELSNNLNDLSAQYEAVVADLNGENPKEYLSKIQIIETQIETIDAEIEDQNDKLADIVKDIDDIDELLFALDSKDLKTDVVGMTLTYPQTIVKTIADTLLKLQEEEVLNPIDLTSIEEEVKEKFKKAAAATTKYKELEDGSNKIETELLAEIAENENAFTTLRSAFNDRGINNEQDAVRLSEDSAELSEYRRRVELYEIEYEETERAIAIAEKRVMADADALDGVVDLEIKLSEIQKDLVDLAKAREDELKGAEEAKARIAVLKVLDDKLKSIQALKDDLKAIAANISENEVSSKDFAVTVLQIAVKYVNEWSSGRYELVVDEMGVNLINVEKDSEVDSLKYTTEETTLINLSVTMAYGDAIAALLGVAVPRLLPWPSVDILNETIAVVAPAVDDKNIILLIERDEDAAVLEKIFANIA